MSGAVSVAGQDAQRERAGRSASSAASRLGREIRNPVLYLGIAGVIVFVLGWYLTTEYFKLPRFEKLPGPVEVWAEFTSRDATSAT